MQDFKTLQEMRSGDLDRRSLGLSPAMLEELCLESHSLHELFEGLASELVVQWRKADVVGVEPSSTYLVRHWNWRLHSVRVAVFRLLGSQYVAAARSEWPEPELPTAEAVDEVYTISIHHVRVRHI